MAEELDSSKPLPMSSVLGILGILGLSIFISVLTISQYKSVFINRADFASYSSFIFLGPAMTLLFLFVLYEAYMRNVRGNFKSTENFLRIAKCLLYFLGLSLLLGPFVIGPTMSRYMKSEGYERCRDTPGQAGLTGRLFPAWAKPSVGCEIWELSGEERKALRSEPSKH